MSVSLRDVVLAVSYGDASLVGESAGYLILGAADIALRTSERGSLDAITIDEEGTVRLRGSPADDEEAERALRHLLGMLLQKVRIPSNNLARVAARRDARGLRGLVGELEAALVPVNRRAARRTLARLCRESQKSAAREHAFAEVEEVKPPGDPAPEMARIHELSPNPEPVQFAPSPEALPVQSAAGGGRAEHVVAAPARRVSERPTVPAKPHPALLDRIARTYGAETPVESAPLVAWRQANELREHTDGFAGLSAEIDDDFVVEDELDEAETQVFAGVAPISESAISEQRSAEQRCAEPRPTPASQAPALRRRHTAGFRTGRVLSDADSLIVMSESAPRRTASDITDLLDRMSVSPTSTEDLYMGLKSLSRIELSPVAPLVEATWSEDERR